MKKLIIVIPLCISFLPADLSVKQIEQMVNKIHLKREGISLKTLENTPEPFILIKKEENTTVMEIPKKQEDAKLSLHAIMAGKAYINEGWKKVGDNILGYTVEYIGKKGVVLKNQNTIKKLFLGKAKSDLIKLEERE